MIAGNNKQDRETLYQFGIARLGTASQENIKILENHLFRLKMNDDYVINSYSEVEELVQFLNNNG